MMTENSERLPRQENMWLKLEKIVIPMKETESEHRAWQEKMLERLDEEIKETRLNESKQKIQ